MPQVEFYSVMLCALVILETNHNTGHLELLCIVSHNKLGPEPTTQHQFLHLYISFYGISCPWGGPQHNRDTCINIRNYFYKTSILSSGQSE